MQILSVTPALKNALLICFTTMRDWFNSTKDYCRCFWGKSDHVGDFFSGESPPSKETFPELL